MNQRELLKDKIGEMQKVLGILDHKIAVYDENLLRIEQDLTDKEMEFEK